MGLYTFFLEYGGGTYISQLKAESPNDAIKKWGEELDVNLVQGLGVKSKEKILNRTKDASLSPIETVKNTWGFTFLVKNELALIHFTKTANDEETI